MSGIFSQLLTKESEQQRQVVKEARNKNDTKNSSDAPASKGDAATSDSNHQNVPRLDASLMSEIVTSLADAKTLPNAISIRMTEDEKEYIDDFILGTLRKERLQGHEVSIAKLMRYALIYLLFRHQKEFVEVLKQSLIKEESRRLFK
jgi:hypothetical protein